MGRRAKNKQGAPMPLHDPTAETRPSTKKLGKRKANLDEGDAQPVTKKIRSGGKDKSAGGKPKSAPAKKAPKKQAAGSDDGWEDVVDEADLKSQTK